MQSVNNKTSTSDVRHEHEKHRPDVILLRSDVIGLILLAIVAFIVITGTVANVWVNKDSYSIKFFTESLLSFLVFIVVTLQVVIYEQQRRIMQQTADSVAIGERAYIGLENWQYGGHDDIEKTITITANVINGGRTPAWNLSVKSQKFRGDEPANLPNWEEAEGSYPAFYRPNAPKIQGFVFRNVSNDEFMAIESGTKKLFIDGECRYTDYIGTKMVFAFGYTHERGKKPRIVIRYEEHREDIQKDSKA
jgi:hypothetical protein